MRREKRLLSLARIRVVGVGGGGGNALNHMIAQGIYGVDFIAINTDGLTLSKSLAPTRICIGKQVTRYLGAGGCPQRGEQAALESIEKIRTALDGSDMVFITAGMGGGTGTGAAPVIAQAAQQLGIFTIAIVTRPFRFEGSRRVQVAEAGLAKLSKFVDTLIVIPNDRLLKVVGEQTSLNDAFYMINDVLYQGVQGISELITVPGLINLDFADVKTIMAGQGPTLIGVGMASGEDRGRRAAKQATCSPLLNMTIDGARSLLVNIIAGTDLCLKEIEQVTGIIKETIHPDANIIFGTTLDNRLGEALRVTVVATGLENIEFFCEPCDISGHRTYPWQQLDPPPAFPPPMPQPAESDESDYSPHDYMVPAFL